MTTAEEMIAAVVAAPDDDAPRLVYADWLSEQGDPRGEFISLQCALAGRMRHGDRTAATQRCRELLAQYTNPWGQELRDAGATRWRFRRGFIEDVQADSRFVTDGAALLERVPVRLLQLHGHAEGLALRLATAPWLARLRTLRVFAGLNSHDARTLTAAPAAAGLVNLSLLGNPIGASGATALAASHHLRLEVLTLTACAIGDDGAAALAASPLMARFTTLYLARCGIGLAGARALARAAAPRLTKLCLDTNQIGDEGAVALMSSPNLKLSHLELERNGITEQGLDALPLGKPGTPRRVRLAGNELGWQRWHQLRREHAELLGS